MTGMGTAEQFSGDRLASFFDTPMARWLGIETTDRPNVYLMRFADRHIGNPLIRALHGGVVGSMIEVSAEIDLARQLPGMRAELVSSAVDYLRVTRDGDLVARVETVRIARRLAFLDVWCWQDDEETSVARGSCTLRLLADTAGEG